MRRSCKDIDLRNYKTLLPWVQDCIRRHHKRFDFRAMLKHYGISRKIYSRVLLKHDYSLFTEAAEKIAKEAAFPNMI